MSAPSRVIVRGVFNEPTLASANNGKANWDRGSTSPLDQKGTTGWLARLYGGVQTGDDWARVNIPVNELRIPEFKAAQWTYDLTNAEVYGINMVIWAHDPDDPGNRIEVTQAPSHADLAKAAGWNKHILDITATQFFFFGENTTGTDLTAGTQYTWEQFQADVLFNKWTIYRITLEYGWYSTGTFEDAWVADIKLNGVVIPLGPSTGTHRKTVLTTKTIVGGANSAEDVISESVDPGTDWDFDFGGTGYITKAIISLATTAKAFRSVLDLYSFPPTCNLKDNVASDGPNAADLPNYIGSIEFMAMSDHGGQSIAVVTPSTVGKAPLEFDSPKLYGVLTDLDGGTWGNVLLSIFLTAEMEDN